MRRALQVLSRWILGTGRNSDSSETVAAPQVLTPIMFPSFQWELLSRANQLLLERAVRQALRRIGAQSAILVSTLPLIPKLFLSDLFSRSIYYCVDDFTLWPGVDSEVARRLELETLESCNSLVATSDHLLSSRGARIRRSLLLTHGVDFQHFMQVQHASPRPEIAELPHPILGMFGVFDARTDGELLQRLAQSFSEGSIAILGPVDRDKRPFEAYRNIHFYGAIPYADLPSWISGFDLCILPYEVNNLSRSISPLKLKEYLATGKPVVSTPLPEVVKLSPYLTVADRDSFIDAVRSARNQESGIRPALQQMLLKESWERKAEQFLRFALEEL